MKKYADDFIGKYKVSKTLRFELKPVGKTAEHLKASQLLANDNRRADQYSTAKDFLDSLHKELIERALTTASIEGWDALEDALYAFHTSKDEKAYATITKQFRVKVFNLLKDDDLYENLTESTPSKLFRGIDRSKYKDKQEMLETFNSFACYFTGFQENRKNLYSIEEIATAIPFRIVNENYPKFSANLKLYKQLQHEAPQILEQAEENFTSKLKGVPLSNYFTPNGFNHCLAQSGIDFYNTLLGGYTENNGTVKIQGINELINLYNQTSSEKPLGRMIPLFKQILSDRDTFSYVLKPFERDEDVYSAITTFHERFTTENLTTKIAQLLHTLDHSTENVYIQASELPFISTAITGAWHSIKDALTEDVEAQLATLTEQKATIKKKVTKKEQEALQAILKQKVFALNELKAFSLSTPSEDGIGTSVTIARYWSDEIMNNYFNAITTTAQKIPAITQNASPLPLRERTEDVDNIKSYLDAVQALLHYLKPFNVVAEQNLNSSFYEPYQALYSLLEGIIPLYNKVRNYITKRDTDTTKIKVMFDYPTLGAGWDENKITDNHAILFKKDGNYYIGILSKKWDKKDTSTLLASDETPHCYRRMFYKYLPGPNKMLPKMLKSKEHMEEYGTQSGYWKLFNEDGKKLDLNCLGEGWRNYEAGKHTSKSLDPKFLCRYIDFCKECIAKNKEWEVFNFKFASSESYSGIDKFYKDVADQGYLIRFENMSETIVTRFVEDGKLYLFQIYNKDFSPNAKGRKNLHTMYWEALFNPENLKDVTLALNGGAEFFFRPAVLKTKVTHNIGEKMVNRRTADGEIIPPAIHKELYKFVNKKSSELSAEAKNWKHRAIIKEVKHPITKHRRYTEDKYFFHVPLAFNFKAQDRALINQEVLSVISDNPDIKIIGLDRGERNLIYLTLINQRGELLKQKSFNIIEQETYDFKKQKTDYHKLLDLREGDRAKARKDWKKIGQIKDLKEGYLSAVIHEIVTMAIEENAIIILEDLNRGFKRGRFKVEKQVYQKFEKMLIDKLNYLVFKDRAIDEAGSVLKGYQLTERFESFSKLGKQSGILFYVPAAYTSKIDPMTGFVNLFPTTKMGKNTTTKRDFFNRFKKISYDAAREAFAFEFDYKDFTEKPSGQSKWTLYSAKERIVYSKKNEKHEVVTPTQNMLDCLGNIDGKQGKDLRVDIQNLSNPQIDKFFKAFVWTLQMRNTDGNVDYIESPVEDSEGVRFNSLEAPATLPRDADANGAYHIALKGLWLLRNYDLEKKKLPILKDEEWFNFVQSRAWEI